MTSHEVIKILESHGWCHVSTKGSHHKFKHPTKKGITIVPHPKKHIPIGTLKNIESQSGLKFIK